ncbi:RGLG4 [Symbiodinium pilosum]|uniref:RGLG4 protein n=1 Tax=Symbiodinium pilosum TaxID=2952 RepID=A0A812WBD1_SYMPI|nr:RGLG4 [Symbiodinium pilosum]
MGNVLLGAGEEGLKLLPIAIGVSFIVYVLVRAIFGGCRPFLHQLSSECGELMGYPPLPPLEPPEAREPFSTESPSLVQVLLDRLPQRSAPLSMLLGLQPASHIPAPSTAEPAAAAGVPTCPVCMLNWPNAALDCGHRVCAACLPEIQRRSNCCPVCRDPIRQVMRLYN